MYHATTFVIFLESEKQRLLYNVNLIFSVMKATAVEGNIAGTRGKYRGWGNRGGDCMYGAHKTIQIQNQSLSAI